jgi:hypothetical protein
MLSLPKPGLSHVDHFLLPSHRGRRGGPRRPSRFPHLRDRLFPIGGVGRGGFVIALAFDFGFPLFARFFSERRVLRLQQTCSWPIPIPIIVPRRRDGIVVMVTGRGCRCIVGRTRRRGRRESGRRTVIPTSIVFQPCFIREHRHWSATATDDAHAISVHGISFTIPSPYNNICGRQKRSLAHRQTSEAGPDGLAIGCVVKVAIASKMH